MEITVKQLIINYYNSDDLKEKEEIQKEIELKNSSHSLRAALLSHFNYFKTTGEKKFLDALIKYSS